MSDEAVPGAITPASGVPATGTTVSTTAPVPLPRSPTPAGPRWPARLFATLSVAAVVGTFVAVEVDQVRRHFPGIDPAKYWLPQLQQVTLPGLGAGLVLGLIAFAFHKLGRRT